jgi:hypothetical protein
MPKMEEDDIIDTGDLPQIAATKSPPGPASSGFGGGFGGTSNATTTTTGFSTGSSTFSQSSPGGFGSSSGYSSPAVTNSFGSQPLGNSAANNTSGQAAGAMHAGGESTVALDKDATDWINKKWRPVMGWVYMGTCTCDFVIFPVLWSLLQALSKGSVTSQWQPLTLQGAGLYHIAMGAVLGIAAYGRTKEKVEGKAG